jgi:hypothetical protein
MNCLTIFGIVIEPENNSKALRQLEKFGKKFLTIFLDAKAETEINSQTQYFFTTIFH